VIRKPIAVMLAEHDAAGEHLHQIEALTGDFMVPGTHARPGRRFMPARGSSPTT